MKTVVLAIALALLAPVAAAAPAAPDPRATPSAEGEDAAVPGARA